MKGTVTTRSHSSFNDIKRFNCTRGLSYFYYETTESLYHSLGMPRIPLLIMQKRLFANDTKLTNDYENCNQ